VCSVCVFVLEKVTLFVVCCVELRVFVVFLLSLCFHANPAQTSCCNLCISSLRNHYICIDNSNTVLFFNFNQWKWKPSAVISASVIYNISTWGDLRLKKIEKKRKNWLWFPHSFTVKKFLITINVKFCHFLKKFSLQQ